MPDPFKNIRRNIAKPEDEPTLPPAVIPQAELPTKNKDRNEPLVQVQEYVQLTPEQVEKLNKWLAKEDLGISSGAGPLMCREGCPHAEICPLYEENIHPIGRQCPLEAGLLMRWRRKWADSLGINIDEEDNDAFDLKMLDDLAAISLLKRRAMSEMALDEPTVAVRLKAGIINDEEIEKLVLNPRIQLIERLGKLELKMYNELLATRKAKFNVAGRLDDLSKRQAALQQKMKEAREKELKKAQIIDAEYTTDA